MKENDRQFIDDLKRAYRPDEMSSSQIDAFNQSLRAELNPVQAEPQFGRWTLAAALIVLGAITLSWTAEIEPTNGQAVEVGIVKNEPLVKTQDVWPIELDVAAFGFDEAEGDELDEFVQEEWLPDDYQALAMVIDFNYE